MIADARPIVYPSRSCSRSDGSPKVGFATRRRVSRARRLNRRLDQHVYRCPLCMAWHLGTRIPRGAVA